MKIINSHTRLVTLIAFLVLTFFSCKEDKVENGNNEPMVRALSNDEKTIIESSNNFSFELLKTINQSFEEENIFISPFSVSTALSMTLNGANGNTKDSIIYALGLEGLTDQQINQAYLDLTTFLFGLDKLDTLTVANSNWAAEYLSLNPNFKQILVDYYDAEVHNVDFQDTKTVDLINDWVEDKTNDKIKDLISTLDPQTIMVLVNAVYFKASWAEKFEKDQTNNRVFYLENGTSIETPMMHNESSIFMTQNESLRLIEIPYGNGQFRFSILTSAYLPDHENYLSVNEILQDLSIEDFNQLVSSLHESEMDLYLPKFKTEFKTELSNVLDQMGMGLAFSGKADFQNLFEEPIEAEISEVIHQSYIDVNEEGTEAAAATAVVIKTTSIGPIANVNQPFLYFIREKHTNTFLFAGKMLNPTK